MKIEIFKIGTHTSSEGRMIEYKVEDLNSIAEIYNEKIKLSNSFKAPIVLGHPKDDEPALGWVDSLAVFGDKLIANIENIPTETKALIDKGYFRKVSISLYADKMLKHIGLLGASAPAVKGLENLNTEKTIEKYSEFQEFIVDSLDYIENESLNINSNNEKITEVYLDNLEEKIQELELKLYKYQLKEKLFKDTNNNKYNNEFSENILEPIFELQLGNEKKLDELLGKKLRTKVEDLLSNIYNFIEDNQKINLNNYQSNNQNNEIEDIINQGLSCRLLDDINNRSNNNNSNNSNNSVNYIEFESKENINPEKLELHKFINEIAIKNNISYTEAIDLIN